MIYINREDKKCKVDGEKEDILLELSYIYYKLRKRYSKDLLHHYIKVADDLYRDEHQKKIKIKKIEIDAKTYEEACEQIDRLIIPQNIKEYIKKNI